MPPSFVEELAMAAETQARLAEVHSWPLADLLTALGDIEFRKWYNDADLRASIARQIRELREFRGLTQAELASRAGTKQPSISRLESGHGLPSFSMLLAVAEALDARVSVTITPWEEELAKLEAHAFRSLQDGVNK